MYISYNWLKDFVKTPAKIKPEDIAEKLTKHTVEVEGFVSQAEQFNNVVVGKVLEVRKHPNADRLRLASVDVKKEKLEIVCGAPNLEAGQVVAVALVGASLPNGLVIRETEIRGEKSSGMICAEDELGLGKNHEGILVLDPGAKIGEPFAKYLKADDTVFEVDNKSLSNRPDLLCHYGLSREIAAIFNLPLKPFEDFMSQPEFPGDKKSLTVKVDDKDLCSRYTAVKLMNIEVKESPAWLKQRLVAIGQRPINNIVDLTNYVMFEIGQPLHAFDAGDMKKIVVRRARKNESLETLDQKERILDEEDLVITDGNKAIAIAGIMGGGNSEINPETTAIILESANFKAASIRKTSQKTALRTEASVRFEKSLDPTLTEHAVLRFISLLRDVCPQMEIASPLIDINNTTVTEPRIEFTFEWLERKIGQEIPRETVITSLEKIGFKPEAGEDSLKVTVPSWRATKDVKIKEDLAEEILRLYGYDNIESRLPVQTLNLPEPNRERSLERKIKNILAFKYGLTEAYSYSFYGEEQLKKLNIDFFTYLKLANPLADTQTLLRQTLAPGLISTVKNNQYKSAELRFFEIGSVFFSAPGTLRRNPEEDDMLPYQEKHLGMAVSSDSPDIFMDIKGIISNLVQTLTNYESEIDFVAPENTPGWADRNLAAKIVLESREIGVVAGLGKDILDNLNIKKPVVLAEINFSIFFEILSGLPPFRFREITKYPPVIRDLAFVVSDRILYNDLKKEIEKFNPLIRSVDLFDVYTGNKLAAGEKSLAFHLTFQSDERTLVAGEVDEIQKGLIAHMFGKFEAKLRDF